MIRVIIAEDEAAIRRGLIHCIRWDELGLELAAEAENGRQALDFLIASPVDILITDMRMPECDGRQLLREIEKRALNCEILVLSEYTDFSYMQQAIHAHVFDYLLKPVDPEHLNALLAQVKEKIERRSNSGDALSALLGAAALTGGRADAALGAYLSSHRDSAFLLGEVLARGAAPAAEFWKGAPFESRFLLLPQERRFAVLSLLPGEGGMRCEHRWRAWFLSRLEAMDCIFRAGVSGGNSLKALPRAHTEAAAALDFVHRSKPVLAYTDIRELGQPALSLPFHDRQLTELIRSGRDVRSELQKSLSLELGRAACLHMPSLRRALTEFTFSLERSCQEAGRGINISTLIGGNYIDRIQTVEWPSDLEVLFHEITDKTFDAFAAQETGSTEGVLRRVLHAVQTRYMEALSLIAFAQEYHINYIYLSRKFKEMTGETFTDALMRVRMEKARQLLEQTDQSIESITQQVGYPTHHYFTKRFKQRYGVTPKEYRQQRRFTPEEEE